MGGRYIQLSCSEELRKEEIAILSLAHGLPRSVDRLRARGDLFLSYLVLNIVVYTRLFTSGR